MHKLAGFCASILVCLLLSGTPAQSADPVPIVISYQPILYWSLPIYVATEKGWWAEQGLKPSFVTFPAGAPQIAAAASGSWDVGGTGSIPAVLGAANYGMETIAVADDESTVDQMIIRSDKVAAIRKDPSLLKGQRILLAANSTADYVVTACLNKYGLKKQDVQIVNMGPSQIISAMTSKNGDTAGAWEPYSYLLAERADGVNFCDAKDTGKVVLAVLVARKDYARQYPDRVAKFLAVYLRATKWLQDNPAQAAKEYTAFLQQGGITLSSKSVEDSVVGNKLFNTDQQLAAFKTGGGKSASDFNVWMDQMSEFMKASGSIPSAPGATSYVTDKYLRMVTSQPALYRYSMNK